MVRTNPVVSMHKRVVSLHPYCSPLSVADWISSWLTRVGCFSCLLFLGKDGKGTQGAGSGVSGWHQGDSLTDLFWSRAGGGGVLHPGVGVVCSKHSILCSWELHDSNWIFWEESVQARPWFRALERPWEVQPLFILVFVSKEGEY